MNAGAVEKVASSAIEALKSTPVVLAILMFNLVFIGIVAWSGHEQGQRWEKMVEIIVKQCSPTEAK